MAESRFAIYAGMPAHGLSSDVLGYLGYEEKVAQQIRRLEVGGPCPALILMLTSELQLSDLDPGGRTFKTQLLFVPPAARPAISQLNGSKRCMEVELAPWAASAITGMAPRDWPRRALPLAEVGKSATLEIDRLACGDSTFEVLFTRTDRILGARIEAARRKVPEEIRWAWSALTAHRGTVPVRELALEVGWSRRYFISCFTECTGLTPKFLSRSFRFQRARQFIATGDLPIAQVASICGYSDQSHFTRECVAFAGCSPSTFRANRLSGLPGVSAAAVEH
jgi:AraC-like DNA-binding protein